MCSMWALECTHSDAPTKLDLPMNGRMCPWALDEGPQTPPSAPSVRMRDKHMTDPCVSHGILFCWSIFADQFRSLFSNLCKLTMPLLNLGSDYSSHFQVQCPPACIFGFWPCTSACPVSRPSAEEVTSFWKLLHTFHSECGRENKTNPVT